MAIDRGITGALPVQATDTALYGQLPKSLLQDYAEEKKHNVRIDASQHNITLLKKSNTLYFFKFPARYIEETEIDIRSECLIGQFLRMLIPRQPEVNLLFKSDAEGAPPLGILSKKVDGFKSFASIGFLKLAYLLLSGSVTGLGEICALLMLTCERDGKVSGNIGVNSHRQTIKLDGGETMLAKFDSQLAARYPIREKDINNLPLPPDFVKRRGITWLYSHLENRELILLWLLSFKKNVRHEINSTLLKFILVPDIFNYHLTRYLLTPMCRPADLQCQLKKRAADVKIAALKNKSFRTYIKSQQAEKDIKDYTLHLDKFTLSDTVKISDSSPDYKTSVIQEFRSLKESSQKYIASYSLSFKVGVAAVMLLLSALIMFSSSHFFDGKLKSFMTRV